MPFYDVTTHFKMNQGQQMPALPVCLFFKAFNQTDQTANLLHSVNTLCKNTELNIQTENEIPATQRTPPEFRFLSNICSTNHI